ETCKACGLCVKRCPMDALSLEDSSKTTNKTGKAAVLDPDKCIGCGVCVYKCPTESLILERKEETCDPPKDTREWMEHWHADKKAAGSKG
ncbi:MAG: 4Fe-4S binding protein, partial [Desulfobacteraceae bacterium]|nr:4Fe-4S binding protein [Desulfobacteraceae bacterium]